MTITVSFWLLVVVSAHTMKESQQDIHACVTQLYCSKIESLSLFIILLLLIIKDVSKHKIRQKSKIRVGYFCLSECKCSSQDGDYVSFITEHVTVFPFFFFFFVLTFPINCTLGYTLSKFSEMQRKKALIISE